METLKSNITYTKNIIPLRRRRHIKFICEFNKPKTKYPGTRIFIYRGGRTRPHHIHFYKGNNFVQMFKSNRTRYFRLANIQSKLFDKNKNIKDYIKKGDYNIEIKKQSLHNS